MRIRTSAHVTRLGACLLLTGGIFAIALQPSTSVGQAAASAAGMNPPGFTDEFMKLGFKFDGAASCSNAQCHGAESPQEGKGNTTLAEFTQWSGGDLHAKAYATLTENEESAKIAAKLKIEATDARCTTCHAVAVPDKLHGKDYSLEEGVTCAGCHGPSEKWIGPHKEKGWTDKQRAQHKTPEALLKATGLYDTKGPLARADMCTSCHLSIDADMVAAGHPQPSFELDYYSKGEDKGGYYVSQHWRDPKVPFYNTQLWATGQVVALRDAMQQLAQRAGGKSTPAAVTSAANQAMAHYAMVKAAVMSGALKGDMKAWDTAAAQITNGLKGKKMPDVAAGAKTIAGGAAKLAPTAGMTKFDKAGVGKTLKAILSDVNTSKMYGEEGMLQQAYAVYSLYTAYNPADKATTDEIVNALFPPEEGKQDPAKFAAGLKAISAKVK